MRMRACNFEGENSRVLIAICQNNNNNNNLFYYRARRSSI